MKKLSTLITIQREHIVHYNRLDIIRYENECFEELTTILDILDIIYRVIIPKSPINIKRENISSISNTFSHAVAAYESGDIYKIFKNLILIEEFVFCIEKNIHEIPICKIKEKLSKLYRLIYKKIDKNELKNKIIHFIWIGDVSKRQLRNVELWATCNKEYHVMLWTDPETLLAGELLRKKKTVLRDNDTTEEGALTLQGNCWRHSQNKKELNDEKIKKCLRMISNKKTDNIQKLRKKIKRRMHRGFSNLKNNHDNIKIMDINVIIRKSKYWREHKIYNFEVFYRTNLAAASDVLRLLILNELGGIYIDIDTMPNIEISFPHTDKYLSESKLNEQEKEKFEAMKNTIAFEKFWGIKSREKESIENHHNFNYIDFLHAIKNDLHRVERKKIFSQLRKIEISFNMIILSRQRNKENVFFSNIIIANNKSPTMALAMNIIRGNYEEIINLAKSSNKNEFISKYALDGYKNSSKITLNISGPGVLLRAAFQSIINTFELPMDIPDVALLRFVNKYLTFTEHTMETEAGLLSSWMK